MLLLINHKIKKLTKWLSLIRGEDFEKRSELSLILFTTTFLGMIIAFCKEIGNCKHGTICHIVAF